MGSEQWNTFYASSVRCLFFFTPNLIKAAWNQVCSAWTAKDRTEIQSGLGMAGLPRVSPSLLCVLLLPFPRCKSP